MARRCTAARREAAWCSSSRARGSSRSRPDCRQQRNLYDTTGNGGAGSFRGLVRDRADLAFGAVAHRDIETAKPYDGLVDQSVDVILLADVGVDELGLRTERAQLLNERLTGLITPTCNDHLGALLGERDGGGAPDAGQGAGDQHDWVAHVPVPHDPISCRRSMDCNAGKMLKVHGCLPMELLSRLR